MKYLVSLIVITCALGCSSSPSQESQPVPSAETSAASPGLDAKETSAYGNESSDVLARKEPGAKKCPKRAKLVKGKCLLPVEETE